MKKTILSVSLAMACAGIARADDFAWIGGASGEWKAAANWSKTSGTSTRTYPNNKVDNVTIGTAATINFAGNYSASQLTVNGDVTFTGGKYLAVYAGVDGTGALTLSGATLRAATGGEVPINTPLVMADGTENVLINVISSSVKAYFVVYGPLRGKGNVSIRASSASYAANSGTILRGDNSAFGGIVRIYPYWASATSNQQNDRPKIYAGSATSAAAQWELNVEHDSYAKALHPGTAFFGTADETYRFGALKANFYRNSDDNAYWATAGVTLEVGGLNLDGYAKGVCVPKDGVIDWVGETATFTNEVTGLARLRLSGGGNLVIGSSGGIPAAITFAGDGGVLRLASGVTDDISAKFSDSTAPVVFDDQGIDHTWASALDASNAGGFVKRGSGTLTWSVAKDAAIEQGTLAVPFGIQLGEVKIAEGAALTVDATGKTTGIALVVTALEDLAQTNRIQFTGTTANIVQILGEGNGVSYVINPHDYVWRGAAGGDWSEASNWDPSGTPAESDSVSFTNAAAVIVDAASSALKLGGSHGLGLGGSYALSVAMSMALANDLTLTPNPMGGETGDDAYGAANRLGVTAGSLTARSVSGEGFVSASGSDLAGIAEAGTTNGFVGTLTARNFTKRGAGVYDLIGAGAFSGTLAVEEGTLRLGTYRDFPGCRFDFDASVTSSFAKDSRGQVTNWASRVGTYAFAYAAGQHVMATNGYFNGTTSLFFRPRADGDTYSRYALAPDNATSGCASRSLFLVYRPTDFGSTSENPYLYGEAGAGGMYYDHASHVAKRKQSGGASADTVGIFTRDAYGSSAITDNPWLTFWSDTYFDPSSSNVETLGTLGGNDGFKGAIAEVVAFTNTLTHAEREVATKQLMRKWGLGYADYLSLKPTVQVTMLAGATLDLGGQTIAAALFEGAGIVTNGVLETARVVQKGGDLSIPAVDGATYVLSQIGEKLMIREAKGKSVKIVVPRSWTKAGYAGWQAVYCEGDVTWDFSAWPCKPVPTYDGNGWWSIPVGGSAFRLR